MRYTTTPIIMTAVIAFVITRLIGISKSSRKKNSTNQQQMEEQEHIAVQAVDNGAWVEQSQDSCAYTHSDIIGKTARAVKPITGSSGFILVKERHAHPITMSARSLSGEQIRAGKQVNIVSVRGSVAIVSETIS